MPGRDWDLKSFIDGGTAEVEIGQKNALIGELRLGESEVGGGEGFALGRGGAGDHQGVERLQRLQVIEPSAERAEFLGRGFAGLGRIDQKSVAQRAIFDAAGVLNVRFNIADFGGSRLFLWWCEGGRAGVEARRIARRPIQRSARARGLGGRRSLAFRGFLAPLCAAHRELGSYAFFYALLK